MDRNNLTKRLTGINSSSQGGTNWGIIVGIIFTIVIVIVIIVLVAKAVNKDASMVIGNPVDMFDFPKKETFDLANSDAGLEFTYSFWMYVHNWNYRRGEFKNVFVKGLPNPDDNIRAPGVWLYPYTNDLHVRVNTFSSPNEGCDLKNIPLQKWVHVVVVLNNRSMDMYVDGKLERSCVLMGIPKLNDEELHVGVDGGYMGKLSKLQYFREALSPDQIYNIYNQGPYL